MMKRSAAEVMDLFEQVAQEAAMMCNKSYRRLCQREQIEGVGEVKVLRYEALLSYAEKKSGLAFIDGIKREVQANKEWDDREKSLRIADQLMIHCQELAPAIVLLFAPPYYPAVNTSNDPLVIDSVQTVKETAKQFGVDISQIHYFNGICDLSYVQYSDHNNGWLAFERNTPVWGDTYSIPFSDMLQLQAPVLNLGPFGKDPHQLTERLHLDSALVYTPAMLESLITSMFNRLAKTG